MSLLLLLRDARTTGDTDAARDALLTIGYDLDRALRACRPYSQPTLATRYEWATEALQVAEEALTECEACDAGVVHPCEEIAAYDAAEAALVIAKAVYGASDEPREYEIRDGNANWTLTSRPSDLAEVVEASVHGGDWDESESWVWAGWSHDEITGDAERHEVTFAAKEPGCSQDEHDWRNPYSVLGGLEDNPGCWGGPNGGITKRSVCAHCQVYKSRATNRNDGTAFASTDYEDADTDSLEWVARHVEAS
jgi:hypothetical protein